MRAQCANVLRNLAYVIVASCAPKDMLSSQNWCRKHTLKHKSSNLVGGVLSQEIPGMGRVAVLLQPGWDGQVRR